MFLRLLFLILLLSFASPACAQEYADPTWTNLLRTMIRFNALDLSDTTLLDEYAIVTECDLYKAYYDNDFEWNNVRKVVRESVKMNVATFPMNFHYDIKMQLDRYDFNAKSFLFRERSVLKNVNTFVLYAIEGTGCGKRNIQNLPRHFRAVIQTPVFMDGLPLAEPDAKALLAQMDEEQNLNRYVYARFNLRTVYIEPLQKITTNISGAKPKFAYQQDKEINASQVRFDMRLDSINFYEDPEMTKLIYQYAPGS